MQIFEDVLATFGMINVGVVPCDGELHRYNMAGAKGKPGWAVKFDDGAGFYGDWRSDDNGVYWHPSGKSYAELSPRQKELAEAQRELYKQAKIRRQEVVADECAAKWLELNDIGRSQYLESKRVGAHGVRFDDSGNVVIPAKDANGKIWSLQTIFADGRKCWTTGGKVSECFFVIEGNKDSVILCEGYATGASIFEATGSTVVICFDAGNMVKVAEQYKRTPGVLVAADHDPEEKGSRGLKAAEEIKQKYGIPYVMPDVYGDFNDLVVDHGVDISSYFFETIEAFSVGQLNADKSPMPKDIIEPRILTPGGMIVFGGAPKVGKSDFILSWLMHMAAGIEFMGMKPPRPLRVFYLQAEIGYYYIRERVRMVDIDNKLMPTIEKNMTITPRLKMILDGDGVKKVGNTIRKMGDVDIIAIDPMRNVYDGDNENDNPQMIRFLQERVEALRSYAKPETGIIIAHHTKKVAKEDLIADPFLCFSGASSLRGFYNTGMMLYRPDEQVSERVLAYEVRDGRPLDNVHLDKIEGRWYKIDKENSRIAKAKDNNKYDAEKQRKMNVIFDTVLTKAAEGKKFNKSDLSFYLDGKNEMGSSRNISRIINIMLKQGDCGIELDDQEMLIISENH